MGSPKHDRQFLPADSTPESVIIGLAWLGGQIGATSDRGLIVVPRLSNIRDGLLGKVLGRSVAAVQKSRTIPLPANGGTVHVPVISSSQVTGAPFADAVLLLWPSTATIGKVDGGNPTARMLALAWSAMDESSWQQDLGFREYGQPAGVTPDTYPTVRAALKNLTNRVNLSTGLGHPSDRDAYVDLLYHLRDAGEVVEGPFVSTTLIELGWQVEDALECAEMAERIRVGRNLRRGKMSSWKEDVVDRWREDAEVDAD